MLEAASEGVVSFALVKSRLYLVGVWNVVGLAGAFRIWVDRVRGVSMRNKTSRRILCPSGMWQDSDLQKRSAKVFSVQHNAQPHSQFTPVRDRPTR